MSRDNPDINSLANLVADLSERHLVPAFDKVQGLDKPDGSLITEADLAMQSALQESLSASWPQISFLGEEMSEADQIIQSGLMWCVDPLDGTTNFASGIPFVSVSVALLEDGYPVLGLVYDPLRGECFTAEKGRGAYLNGEPLHASNKNIRLAQCVANVDFKRLSASLASKIATENPYRSQRNFGSCALEWCWLAAGRIDVYLHGGMKLWDYAAGSVIHGEVGGLSCTLIGESVPSPRSEPRSVVAAQDERLFKEWKEFLGVPEST